MKKEQKSDRLTSSIEGALVLLIGSLLLLGGLSLPTTWDLGMSSSIVLKGTLLDWLKWEYWGALPASSTGEIVEASVWTILGYIAGAVFLWEAKLEPIKHLKVYKIGVLLSIVFLLKTLAWGWLNALPYEVQLLDCGILLWLGLLLTFVYSQTQHLCTRNQVFLC